MTNDSGIVPLIGIAQLVDGQRFHLIGECISTARGGSEGRGQITFMVPCDLCCHDEWVVIPDCDSNSDFSVDQSDHHGADGGDDRNS